MARKSAVVFFLCASVFCLPLAAQSAGNTTKSFLEEWRQTLKYGIDQEILEVIQKLKALKQTGLDNELLELLGRSVSTDVRKAVLDLFTQEKNAAAENIAVTLLENHENEEPDLIRALLIYLGEIKSRKAGSVVNALVASDNDSIAGQAILTLGKIADPATEELLLAKLNDIEYPLARKSQIILALGDLGGAKAVDTLMQIVESRDADKVWRMYACQSLGKIKDPRALPVIKKAFAQGDPLLKAYAIGALANFNIHDVIDLLIQGLKDNFWKVRVAAAQGLARPEGAPAVPILKYKAFHDPENVVRSEAIRALGAIGTGEALTVLRGLFEDTGQTMDIRGTALAALVDNDLSPATIASIERVIAYAGERNDQRVLDFIARKLSITKAGSLRPIYVIFMESTYFVLRVQGIRGAVTNQMNDLKGRIRDLSEKDPNPAVKKEALSALEQM
jgi:HEAT repeat protein